MWDSNSVPTNDSCKNSYTMEFQWRWIEQGRDYFFSWGLRIIQHNTVTVFEKCHFSFTIKGILCRIFLTKKTKLLTVLSACNTLLCSGRFLASAIVEKDSWKSCIWRPGNATQQSTIPLRNSLTATLNDDLKNTDWQILRIPLFVLGWEQKSQRHISKKRK